jgi:hypothetical protein
MCGTELSGLACLLQWRYHFTETVMCISIIGRLTYERASTAVSNNCKFIRGDNLNQLTDVGCSDEQLLLTPSN